ncbi:MAG: glycosyl hydrolase [Victivallaceae bacterium]
MNNSMFNHPPAECRGMPFWSLNDRLEPAEMIRQVEEFHRAGMGGFFLHSRTGLITEYLGAEWMAVLRAAVEKAAELGMEAWLYDEDKWPSGFAGGIVPVENPEYRGQYLGRLQAGAPLPEQSEVVLEKDGWIYFTAICPLGIAWFNGTCYTDLMNPDAVAAYIRSTHEKYKAAFGQYFGTVIPGIFTDEPIMRMRPGWGPCDCELLPYSPHLVKRYLTTYGESPLPHVDALFADLPDSAKYRYRYWKMATGQFAEAYTKQIAEWCERNKLKLTGHFMYEDSVELQTRWIGKAMAHYEHMQIPGIDHLSLNIDNILTAKQCSSMANQQGKKVTLSEMYGAAGQNMNFEDRKWIAGWHGVMGINFICHHLSLYSTRGCRKRDYPPTFTWHQPYWHEHAAIEDWQARLTCLLREGDFSADFLIIHPAESGWCLQRGNNADARLESLDRELNSILQEMFSNHYDFELGDEDFMARLATVQNGGFTVGKMQYRAVIVPPMHTIRESTLQLLEEFSRHGGRIITCGTLPQLTDGEAGAAAHRLCRISVCHIENTAELETAIEKTLPAQHKIAGHNHHNVFIQRRRTENGELLVMFNSSRHEDAAIELKDRQNQRIELCLDSGENRQFAENTVLLAPAQTRVLLLTELTSAPVLVENKKQMEAALPITGPWRLECAGPNSLPLDFAEWSFDGKNWNSAEPCIGLKMRLDEQRYNGPLYLRHSFISRITSGISIDFAAELPAGTPLKVNNHNLVTGHDCYLDQSILKTDISHLLIQELNTIEFKLDFVYGDPTKYDNPALRYGTELESAYLTGDFGVYGIPAAADKLPIQISHDIWKTELPERRVTRLHGPVYLGEKTNCSDGELTLSGLPFYAGAVRMSAEFIIPHGSFTAISFECLDAVTARIWLNGKPVEHLFNSRPLTADITGMLRQGSNHIKVELRNSLRNLLGPHHHTLGELCSVGPYSFISRDFKPGTYLPDLEWSKPGNRAEQESWTDDYFLVRFGLSAGINLR